MSIGVFSLFANLLMLTGPLFMLQVYDRVLTSGSFPTLLALALLVAILYAAYGFLEFIRSRLLVRTGRIVDEALRERVFDAMAAQALRPSAGPRSEPLSDLQTIRQFLQSNGPLAFLDMPWAPVYLGVIFLMHSLLGYAALAAAILLGVIAVAAEQITRRHAAESQKATLQANILAEQCRSNVEAATVLGMMGRLRQRWAGTQDKALDSQTLASDRGGLLTGLSRTLRLVFQSAILGLGAYLAIRREISPGSMVAASIIMSRALAPVEQAVGQWPQFQGFVRSWKRLKAFLAEMPHPPRMPLPKLTGSLAVENLQAFAPGVEKPIVGGVSFTLESGSGLGILGPTGAGKSTLARALIGVWPLTRGTIRLDGATPDQWDPDILGASIGYLSQESELFEGTVAENISRFAADPDPQSIIAAARQAEIHDLVLQLPDGYNTVIGRSGRRLSAGQRQRVGLARALYGDPALLVLDEPNANLDAVGEAALVKAIAQVRKRGGTVLVIAHRPSAITALDKLLVLKEGRVIAFGPKDEVLSKILARPPEGAGRSTGLTVVEGGGQA